MMRYELIAISICLLAGFRAISRFDEEISSTLALGTGALVLVAYLLFPGGFLTLAMYVVGGFALLTVYKIVRSARRKRIRRQHDSSAKRDGTAGGG